MASRRKRQRKQPGTGRQPPRRAATGGWLQPLSTIPGNWWLLLPLGVAVSIAVLLGNPVAAKHLYERDEVLDAIRWVETRDVANPGDGDGGLAIGPYQIHEVYWRDAVAFEPGLGGNYQDCREKAYAERVIDAYMRRWLPDAWRDGFAEAIARVHNGGPTGAEKAATLPYWRKVKARLEQ